MKIILAIAVDIACFYSVFFIGHILLFYFFVPLVNEWWAYPTFIILSLSSIAFFFVLGFFFTAFLTQER